MKKRRNRNSKLSTPPPLGVYLDELVDIDDLVHVYRLGDLAISGHFDDLQMMKTY
jgi:hypothetical protein